MSKKLFTIFLSIIIGLALFGFSAIIVLGAKTGRLAITETTDYNTGDVPPDARTLEEEEGIAPIESVTAPVSDDEVPPDAARLEADGENVEDTISTDIVPDAALIMEEDSAVIQTIDDEDKDEDEDEDETREQEDKDMEIDTRYYQEEQKKEQKEQEEARQRLEVKVKISSPKNNKRIKSKIKIEGSATRSEIVEIYLKQAVSGAEAQHIFIGEAKVKKNKWFLHWDSSSMPNGRYHLMALDKYTAKGDMVLDAIIVENPVIEPEKPKPLTGKRVEELNDTVETIEDTTKDLNDEVENLSQPDKTKEEQELANEIINVVTDLKDASAMVQKKVDDTQKTEKVDLLVEEVVEVAEKEGFEAAVKKAEELTENYQKEEEALVKEIKTVINKTEEINKKIVEKAQTSGSTDLAALAQKTEKTKQKLQETVQLLEESKFENLAPNADVVLDSDGDGLNDMLEAVYETNTNNPDSDNDGYLDGIEVASGYDPLDPTPAAKVVLQEPKTAGMVKKNIYAITAVDNTRVADALTEIEQERPIFKGRALPNSFVNLYIYSLLPVVVSTKADADGQWSYVLSKALGSGEHEVYVAVTNNEGKVVAKSEPYPFFILEARAVTPETYFESDEYLQSFEAEEATKSMIMPYAYATLFVILIGLIVAVVFIIKKGESTEKIIKRDFKL